MGYIFEEMKEQERKRIQKLFAKAPTPVHNLKDGATSSKEMTPADPITQYEHYSIGDLRKQWSLNL